MYRNEQDTSKVALQKLDFVEKVIRPHGRLTGAQKLNWDVSEQVAEAPRSEVPWSLKVSLRMALGPNLGCQSQPRQCALKRVILSMVVIN